MRLERDREVETSAHVERRADRWGAAIAGGLLLSLPVVGGFYRSAFTWVDLVLTLMGIGGIALAVASFVQDSREL